jgi:hypothetical protein
MATIITRKTNYRNHFQSFDSRLSNRFVNTARRIAGNRAFLIHPVDTPVKSLMFPYFWFRDRSGTIGATGTLKRLEPVVSLKRLERSAAVERLERLEPLELLERDR